MGSAIKLSSPATSQFWEIAVLYEDSDLLALNKPPGLATTADPEQPQLPSLMRLLHAGIRDGKPWAVERKLEYLMNAHRLDAEASGVLLLAKAKSVFIALADAFGAGRPVVKYAALACGVAVQDTFEVDAKISSVPAPQGFFRIDPRSGKKSQTRIQVVERFKRHTLLNCEAVTDRPHQVRAHLRHIRLPLAGDSLYGGQLLLLSSLKPEYRLKPGKSERPLLSSPALHLEQLRLAHPGTGGELVIQAPWPKDFEVAVKFLRRHAAAPGGGEGGPDSQNSLPG